MLSTEKNVSTWNFFFVGKESTIYAADYGGTVKLKENVQQAQQEARCDFRIIKTLQEPLKNPIIMLFFFGFFLVLFPSDIGHLHRFLIYIFNVRHIRFT